MRTHTDLHKFHEKVAFQLNDTHPTVAVAELMRVLMDDHDLSWDEAWEITCKTCAYTNHTIMSEALEKWPIELFSRLLPRIYQIVEEINRRFVLRIQQMYPGNQEKIRKMAIIYDGLPLQELFSLLFSIFFILRQCRHKQFSDMLFSFPYYPFLFPSQSI